jgi:hypothetical protein
VNAATARNVIARDRKSLPANAQNDGITSLRRSRETFSRPGRNVPSTPASLGQAACGRRTFAWTGCALDSRGAMYPAAKAPALHHVGQYVEVARIRTSVKVVFLKYKPISSNFKY